MSVSADGPEEIVEAEEYLQPAGDEIIGESTSPPHRHHRSHHHHYPNGRLEKVSGLLEYIQFFATCLLCLLGQDSIFFFQIQTFLSGLPMPRKTVIRIPIAFQME